MNAASSNVSASWPTAFLALMRKDLILFFSDRRALLINLLLPIAIGTFFGYLFGGSGKSEAARIEVALVQQDGGAVSARIAAQLKADAALKVDAMDLEQARALVAKGTYKVAVVIPKDFGEQAGAALFGAGKQPVVDMLYDPSQQVVLSMVKGILTQHAMQAVSAEMMGGAGGGKLIEKSMAQLEAQGTQNAESAALKDFLGSYQKFQQRPRKEGAAGGVGMSTPFATRDEQVSSGKLASGKVDAGYNGYAHSFAGMGVQFILFLGINIGIDVLLARRSGIWNRLLAAPVSLSTVLLARAASAALICFGLLCAIFAFAVLVLGVRIANPLGFIGVGVCFALLTSSFGLFIAAFGKTPEAARGVAVFATLIMVMLGGAWVPSFMFPAWVQQVSLAVPTRWAIDGLDAMTWRGLGIDAALLPMGVQLAFAAVFAVLAVWKFKRQQG